MQYTRLGRTGLMVSRLCLGTMNFGPETSELDSFVIMDKALELGINFFDTANVYGWKKGEGITERIVGRWFAMGGGRREKTVIATKVYGNMGDWPNESRLSALHIKRACEDSLKRMRTDYIDIYQMHHIDRNTPWEEIWQAMEQLVQQGKVLYVGSSNFAGWHIAQANEAAKARHFMGLVSEQSLYHLGQRSIELEVIPACQHYGLYLDSNHLRTFHAANDGERNRYKLRIRYYDDDPYSPVAFEIKRRMNEGAQKFIKEHGAQLKRYEAFCDKLGEKPADVALAWVLKNPVVTAPIIGPRTIEQLTGSLRALEINLTDSQMKKLDEIWPGPGGPAPEAYAW